jgi:uncharacterized protein with PIN domain
VLDTWALLAYLDGEPAAQRVRQVLRSARRKQVVVLLSLITYGECLYVIEREQGFHQAQRAIGIIEQLALRLMPADRPLVFEASPRQSALSRFVCRRVQRRARQAKQWTRHDGRSRVQGRRVRGPGALAARSSTVIFRTSVISSRRQTRSERDYSPMTPVWRS